MLCSLLAREACAQDDERVALVVPEASTKASARAEERLRAELMAAGYEVITVPVAGISERTRLRAIAKRTRSTAAVSVHLSAGVLQGVVWAKDAHDGEESVARVRPAPATLEGAATFAIWAAEQLRASMLAFESEPAPQPPASPAPKEPPPPDQEPEPAEPIEPTREPSITSPQPEHPYAVGGGVAVLLGPGGVPASFGPAITLSWHPGPWFASLRLVGPVSSSLVTDSGTIDIDQEQALMRVGADVDLGGDRARLVPFVSAGLGAYRLGARGDAVAPYTSKANQAWSGVFQVTGGLRFHLSQMVYVAGEGGVWVAGARPVVRIEGSPNVHIGRPGYIGMLGLGLSW